MPSNGGLENGIAVENGGASPRSKNKGLWGAASKKFRTLSRKFGTNKPTRQKQDRRLPENARDYELIELCGQGASSTVVRARCKTTGDEVAIKCVDLDSLQLDLDMFVRETAVMRRMRHPNLLPLYATSVESQRLWIITPYVSGGSVENILLYAFPNGFCEKVIATFSKKVLQALAYLHKEGIVHRDIKASNVMLSQKGRVFLGDLGIAAQVVVEDEKSPGHMLRLERHTFAGTLQYISPEIAEGIGYSESTDIWSYGIMMLELVTGKRPFGGLSTHKALMSIIHDDPPEPPETCSEALRDFISHCLCKDPNERWTAEQLLNHKFHKLAEDDAYLVDQLVSKLPPEAERSKVFMQLAAAQESKDGGPSCDTVYLDGLKRLALLQPGSDDDFQEVAGSKGSKGSKDNGGLQVERAMPSWNFSVSAMRSLASSISQSFSMRGGGSSDKDTKKSFAFKKDVQPIAEGAPAHFEPRAPQPAAIVRAVNPITRQPLRINTAVAAGSPSTTSEMTYRPSTNSSMSSAASPFLTIASTNSDDSTHNRRSTRAPSTGSNQDAFTRQNSVSTDNTEPPTPHRIAAAEKKGVKWSPAVQSRKAARKDGNGSLHGAQSLSRATSTKSQQNVNYM